jgi:predicted RNA-binding Zn ribbon-like protein
MVIIAPDKNEGAPTRSSMLIPATPADLCLAFANTLSWRGSAVSTESLNGLADLLAWLDRAVHASPSATREIAGWARRHDRAAAKLFSDAIGMREVIFRVFQSVAAGAPFGIRDFAALSDALARAPARSRLARTAGGYGWRLEPPEPTASDLLAPVLWSAADLLVAGGRIRVRQCANDKCLWLFLDASKNGTRRWCDMASCGNRAKARRHYLKRSRG